MTRSWAGPSALIVAGAPSRARGANCKARAQHPWYSDSILDTPRRRLCPPAEGSWLRPALPENRHRRVSNRLRDERVVRSAPLPQEFGHRPPCVGALHA